MILLLLQMASIVLHSDQIDAKRLVYFMQRNCKQIFISVAVRFDLGHLSFERKRGEAMDDRNQAHTGCARMVHEKRMKEQMKLGMTVVIQFNDA